MIANALPAAGCAAALAYPLNRILQARYGSRTLLAFAPCWEEAVKAGSAVVWATPFWPVHLLFGGVEAAADAFTGRQPGWHDALLSIALHATTAAAACAGQLLYNVLAGTVPQTVPELFLRGPTVAEGVTAWLAGALLHVLWNHRVLVALQRRSVRRR
jgi:hypothetical protein